MEKGRTRDSMAVTGVEGGYDKQGSLSLMSRTHRVVGSSLELAQALPQKMLPGHSTALAQNSGRRSPRQRMVHFLE